MSKKVNFNQDLATLLFLKDLKLGIIKIYIKFQLIQTFIFSERENDRMDNRNCYFCDFCDDMDTKKKGKSLFDNKP